MDFHNWRFGALALGGVLLVGAALRLVWVGDMEYKYDEKWTYFQTRDDCKREASLWLGIHNTTGFRCPGMSVWVFIALGKLFAAHEPTTLARAVQLTNVLALIILVIFVLRSVPKEEQEPWFWAAALVAVNPLSVLFHRKIWPPSILPLFSILIIIGWWHRRRRLGAFTWGLVGACVGQVHASGYFFAAAFVAWALLFERKNVRWGYWFLGSCLGALPLIPWAWYVLTTQSDESIAQTAWVHLLELKFWLRLLVEPFGIGLEYSLHTDFRDFLAYPLVGGRPTYLVGLLHVLGVAIGVAILARGAWLLWQRREHFKDWWIGRDSPTAFTQSAALWGFGILLTLSTVPINRHYLIILFPLEFLWVARLALARGGDGPERRRPGRTLLLGLCATELLLTVSFLGYIHVNHGSQAGDYGIVYRVQEHSDYLPPSDDLVRGAARRGR